MRMQKNKTKDTWKKFLFYLNKTLGVVLFISFVVSFVIAKCLAENKFNYPAIIMVSIGIAFVCWFYLPLIIREFKES